MTSFGINRAGMLFVLVLTLTSIGHDTMAQSAAAPPSDTQQSHTQPPAASDIAFDQHLGAVVPMSVQFVDQSGSLRSLEQYIDGRPAILMMGYYACPNLCSVVRVSLLHALQTVGMKAQSDYRVLAVSIDSAETPDLANHELRATLNSEALPDTTPGWQFLTGEADAVAALAQSVGFHYAYDATVKQYAHPAGIVILTPQGKVSRYFFGVDYPSAELRQALHDAAGGEVGSPIRALLLRCFHYDPVTGRYSTTVDAALRALGIATFAAMATLIIVLRRRERSGHGQGKSS